MAIYDHFSETDLAILRERAERAARLSTDRGSQTENTVLLVYLGNEIYALPIEALMAVYTGIRVVSVPCVPAYVAGIVNIRGRIIPVLDLGVLLGVPQRSDQQEYSLVAAANIALRVEKVGEVITFNAVSPIPDNQTLFKRQYVQGLLPDGAILLDLNRLLSDEMLMVNETI